MSDTGTSHERLVADLVADLRPVRRLAPAWLRTMGWLTIVLALAVVLAWFADMPAVKARLMAVPDMWLAVLGEILTAALAAFAAFQLSLPDGTPRWALLPIPGLALWLGASGMGCARTWLIPGATDASMAETMHCLRFIVLLSIPLSLAIFWLLRRGFSLYPSLMGGTAGLAVAASAAALLNFFHPFDATATDLAVHAGAVLLVVGANRVVGGWVFGRGMRRA